MSLTSVQNHFNIDLSECLKRHFGTHSSESEDDSDSDTKYSDEVLEINKPPPYIIESGVIKSFPGQNGKAIPEVRKRRNKKGSKGSQENARTLVEREAELASKRIFFEKLSEQETSTCLKSTADLQDRPSDPANNCLSPLQDAWSTVVKNPKVIKKVVEPKKNGNKYEKLPLPLFTKARQMIKNTKGNNKKVPPKATFSRYDIKPPQGGATYSDFTPVKHKKRGQKRNNESPSKTLENTSVNKFSALSTFEDDSDCDNDKTVDAASSTDKPNGAINESDNKPLNEDIIDATFEASQIMKLDVNKSATRKSTPIKKRKNKAKSVKSVHIQQRKKDRIHQHPDNSQRFDDDICETFVGTNLSTSLYIAGKINSMYHHVPQESRMAKTHLFYEAVNEDVIKCLCSKILNQSLTFEQNFDQTTNIVTQRPQTGRKYFFTGLDL